MATGRRPFQGRATAELTDAILHAAPPPPSRVQADVSRRFEDVIVKCLEKDPAGRYASIRDLATSVKITVVSIPLEVVSKIGDPAYLPASIPANTYTGQTDAVPTVAVRNFLVTSESVSADTVYAMTKALFTNLDQMAAAHAAAKSITAADAPKNVPVPLHPGAERYYREAGLLK